MFKQIPEFQPDISSIDFPSDRITIGQMRRKNPEIMQNDRAMLDRHPANVEAINAARIEHILARKAWAAAIGLPDPDTFRDRREEVVYLNRIYRSYGLSKGRHQTDEMVRRFETEAARLAKLSIGVGRE